ncbi:MAG: hypothetical protein JXB03_06140 [Spirochaetales bacterium]|nr:hypothetical protein [Spirochaetales bacterium]
MKGSHRIAISLLVSIVLSSLIAVSAYGGLFRLVDTKFYSTRMYRFYQTQGEKISESIDSLHERNIIKFTTILKETQIWRNYVANQSLEVIRESRRTVQLLNQESENLIGIRLIDVEGGIHFSSFISDRRTANDFQIIYDDFDNVQTELTVSDVKNGRQVFLLNALGSGYVVYPIEIKDTANISRGFALVYIGSVGFVSEMLEAGNIDMGTTVHVISQKGLLIYKSMYSDKNLLSIISDSWAEGPAGAASFAVEKEDGTVFQLFQVPSKYGYTVGMLVPETSFRLSASMKLLLVVSLCVSVFLFVFLIINLKQDDAVVFEARLKHFHESIFIEYLENQRSIPLDKWFRELDARKDQIKNNLLSSIARKQRPEFEKQFDISWSQLVESFQDQTSNIPLPDASKLEALLNKVLHNQLQNAPIRIQTTHEETSNTMKTNTSSVSPQSLGSQKLSQIMKKSEESIGMDTVGEIEEVEEIEDAEEIEEMEEVTAAEEIEEIEEVEAAEEIEEIEEAETVGEIKEAEEIEDAEEIEEMEEVEAAEEIEEIEEAETVGEIEAAEEIEDAEEIEEFEEVETAKEIEEIEEAETLGELDEIDEVENVDVPVSASRRKGVRNNRDIPVLEYQEPEYELVRIDLEGRQQEAPVISAIGYSMMNPETIIDDDEVLDLTALFSGEDDLGNIEVFEDSVDDVDIVTEIMDEVDGKEIYDEGEEIELLLCADDVEGINQQPENKEISIIPLPELPQEELEEIQNIQESESEIVGALPVQEIGKSEIYNPQPRDFCYGLRGIDQRDGGFDDAFESRNFFAKLDELVATFNAHENCEIYHLSEVIINEDRKRINQKLQSMQKHKLPQDLDYEISELVETILPHPVDEDLSIDSLLSKKSVDLTAGLEDEDSLDADETDDVFVSVERNYLKMRGFDFDAYSASFRQGSMGTIKGLMRLSSKFNAFYAALLKFTDTGLRVTQSLGMDSLSINQLHIDENEEGMKLFKNNLIVYLRSGKVGIPFFDSKMVGRDRSYLQGSIYFPVIFNNVPAYLYLGLKNSRLGIEDWMSILSNA